ncbi:helix-turn-helix domain-containing protein [Pseudomonas sp. SA3-5]|uniref:Helix-turn-helix domain-containing protein n=1 Tax=Pseudomonas aestuarii TaxID=3018340 RepID=A0ABT4XEP9_9PSED|nr:helix-turn-helix domain-containing protein [Pseudomonas aestuarii]MDA7086655.1 helix-turn-helix domain-containing protein [Pseudomonas aestuarii]
MLSGPRTGDSVVLAAKALRSTVIEDASVQAAMQPWIEMECYQLSTGKQLARMETLDLGSQQIVRESQATSVQKLGVTPANLCTLSYCTPTPNFRFSEIGASETDSLFFMPEHTEFDIYVPAGAQTAYVSFDQDEFLKGARALNPEQWERTPEQLQQLQTAQQAALKGAINHWFSMTRELGAYMPAVDKGLMRRLLLENILQVATTANLTESQPPPVERARAFHICRMARTFVEDSLAVDAVPTVTDICRTIGVSERALQYAFRAYVDLSPVAYLRLCRLNHVRVTLRALDPCTATVTSVAMRFGFLHLGRFAQDYRQLFDESPSVTLAC